jgi:hypothetical protein
MDTKVYIVDGQTLSYGDVFSNIVGVFLTEESAKKRMREAIDAVCAEVKLSLEEQFNDEDYEEDYEGYVSFDEFWDDFVSENFVTSHLWRYSDESDYTYIVMITERELEN